MGRLFLLFYSIFSFILVSPAFAKTISHNITVTATVLPSPGWIQLLRSESSVSRIDLPFLNFVTYQLQLFDGRNFIKNQPVILTAENTTIQSEPTNSDGIADFYLPRSLFFKRLEFICLIQGREIPLFSEEALLSDI